MIKNAQARIIVILILLLLLVVISNILLMIYSNKYFHIITQGEVSHQKRIMNEILNYQKSSLANYAKDYSAWDEMLTAVAQRDTVWLKNNINVGMTTYKINVVWI